MSTQRRVVPGQRFAYTEKLKTEFAGIADPTSPDEGISGSKTQFRRAAMGLTASAFHFGNGRIELATNSLSFNSCWERRDSTFGIFPEQLPLISPLLSGVSEPERCSAPTKQSALPQIPWSVCPGTERQHGQGNLYFKHAARNAACNSGRRSALGDLLRAGK